MCIHMNSNFVANHCLTNTINQNCNKYITPTILNTLLFKLSFVSKIKKILTPDKDTIKTRNKKEVYFEYTIKNEFIYLQLLEKKLASKENYCMNKALCRQQKSQNDFSSSYQQLLL